MATKSLKALYKGFEAVYEQERRLNGSQPVQFELADIFIFLYKLLRGKYSAVIRQKTFERFLNNLGCSESVLELAHEAWKVSAE